MPRSLTTRHRELDRYLLDGERVVTAVHQHWGKVAEPVASAVAGGALALWVDATVPARFGLLSTLVWWAWFAVVGRAAYKLAEWRHDWFVATDRRLLLFYGFITRKVSMMPLSKVTDMSYTRSVPGRLLGYGRFVMESAGQDQALREVGWVPQPDANYRAICTEIFRFSDRRLAGTGSARLDPEDRAPGSPLLDPHAGWEDERHATAIPVEAPRGVGDESLYRSPDRRSPDRRRADPEGRVDAEGEVDRDADTGPITYRSPSNRWHRDR